MSKKIVLMICMLLLSVGLLSGCLGDDKPKIKYTEGNLDDVVHSYSKKYHFIFSDDTVFPCWSDYNLSYLKSFIGARIKIRYYDDYGNTMLDIKNLE